MKTDFEAAFTDEVIVVLDTREYPELREQVPPSSSFYYYYFFDFIVVFIFRHISRCWS